jgi:hypothetical protein
VGQMTPRPQQVPYDMPALRNSPGGGATRWAEGVDPYGQASRLGGMLHKALRPDPNIPQVNMARTMAGATPPAAAFVPGGNNPYAAIGAMAGVGGEYKAPILHGDRIGDPVATAPYMNGMAPVPRQWTAEDLEPTSVLGASGFNFTKPSQGFTMANGNLPLFRADMANRAQMTNFAAEMANSANRMAFQAGENDRDRQNRLDIAGMGNDVKLGGLNVRSLDMISKLPPGPLRDKAVDSLADASSTEKIDLKYGDLLKSDKLTQHNLSGLLPFISENTDLAGLAQALEQRRGISIDKRLASLTGQGNPWYSRPVVGSPTPGSDWHQSLLGGFDQSRLSPEASAEYGLLQKLKQAMMPRR